MPYVVDTNVIVIANNKGSGSYACAYACTQGLETVQTSGRLILDDAKRILDEYFSNSNPFIPFGVGNSFVKWVHDYQGWPCLVEKIAITPKETDQRDFEEFPDHPGLSKFDPSDRKFVAVANAHPAKPPIMEALDSKWWGWKEALKACGITVEFLCPDEIKKLYDGKFGVSS